MTVPFDEDTTDMLDALKHASPESLLSVAIVVAGIVAKRWITTQGTANRVGRRATDLDCATLTKDVEELKASLLAIKSRLDKIG